MRATTTSISRSGNLNETKFDGRLDQTFLNKDSLFGRFSYDQAFSFVPGGSPGFAEANAFGSNQRIINHARNVGSRRDPRLFGHDDQPGQFWLQPHLRLHHFAGHREPAFPPPLAAAFPTPTWDAPAPSALPGAYSCGLVSTMFRWLLGARDRGYSPFQGGTNIFSFRDSLDLIRTSTTSSAGIDFRANQMNVGTEAFQDGFWIVGNGGNFTGSMRAGIGGNPEADCLLGITGLAIHDQTFDGPVTGRRWKIYRPFVEDNWRVTPNIVLNLGLAWDMTTPITEAQDARPTTFRLRVSF